MPKGYEPCPVCGRMTRPSHRKTPHSETAECKATMIAREFQAMGWEQALNVTHGKILEESGVPVEWAAAGVHAEEQVFVERKPSYLTDNVEEWLPMKKHRVVMVQHDVPFAPKEALRAIGLLQRVGFPGPFRRRAIRALWRHPEYLDAIDSIRRMKGNVKAFVHQCVVQVEEQDRGESTES